MKDIPGFVIVLTTTCVQYPHCIFCTSREYLANKLKTGGKKNNRKASKKYFVEKTAFHLKLLCKVLLQNRHA